jgi:hypothetical protein
MKIIDGIKLKGYPVVIQDTSREDLPEFFQQMGFKVGAEIGVYKGNFTHKFCSAGMYMYGVDPWTVYQGFDREKDAKLQIQEELYQKAVNRLKRFNNVKLIRKSSMDALGEIHDNSLDFVYIDGNHDFRYVAEDVAEWANKVRVGGVVSGHDYGVNPGGVLEDIFQVKPVIHAYLEAFGIKNFYVIGTQDHTSSWFWIKE